MKSEKEAFDKTLKSFYYYEAHSVSEIFLLGRLQRSRLC